jgi:hypothetical protein
MKGLKVVKEKLAALLAGEVIVTGVLKEGS